MRRAASPPIYWRLLGQPLPLPASFYQCVLQMRSDMHMAPRVDVKNERKSAGTHNFVDLFSTRPKLESRKGLVNVEGGMLAGKPAKHMAAHVWVQISISIRCDMSERICNFSIFVKELQ